MKAIYENESLSKYNWFNLGGPAKIFFKLQSVDELKGFLKDNKKKNYKIHILGAGSNTLFRDGGFDGIVIKLGNNFSYTKLLKEDEIEVGAATMDRKLSDFATENSLSGFEFLSCIPGSIGGSIVMNSGCYGEDISKIFLSLKAINFEGEIESFNRDQIKFFYRGNNLKENLIILSAVFKGKILDKKKILEKQTNLINKKSVSKAVKKLQTKKYVYSGNLSPPKGLSLTGDLKVEWKSRKQLLFRSSSFGDDVDRPLQKADGSWTYFAGDIAYHHNKISRKFDILINILGSDHSGYIKRITSATKALSENKTNLKCKVCQMVKLFKNGEPFVMSKRKGDYITVEDLVKEVGKDSVRFMMLNRSNDVELDFDFKKVTEKSKDNPIFYVQYAYARINSIFKILNIKLEKKIQFNKKKFQLNTYEIEILKKISEWPKCVDLSSSKLEPHRIPFYLYELVTLFHSYWNLGKDNKEFRFVTDRKDLNFLRLALLQALSIVIKNGMSILGVSTPRSM